MSNQFFNGYPYTDFHELNLSWVIDQIRSFATTLEQFVSINALKYADPIQWNITTQYEKNTIVIDPQTGTAYISVAPVPVGVSLSNTDYWTEVFDLSGFVTRASANLANRVETTSTTTATFNTPRNSWLVWNDTLYVALVDITAGDSYVENSNIQRFTIESLSGHLSDLATTNKSNLVSAINEVLNTLTTQITNEATARVNADNVLTSSITTLSNRVDDITDISSINDENVIFITDSYGLDSAVGGPSFTTLLSAKYTNATYLVEGGTGFASDEYISSNWLSMLTAHVNTLSADEKKKIQQIIVVGGANDGNLINNGTITTTILSNKIIAFCNYVKANLPKAIIKCSYVGWFRRFDHHSAYLQAIEVYKSVNLPNYSYYASGEAIMRNNAFIESVTNIHPTVEASTYLATFVSSMVTDGDYQFVYETDATMVDPHAPITTVDSITHIFSRFIDKTNNILFLGNQNSSFFRIILGTDGTGYSITPGDFLILGDITGTQVGTSNPYLSHTLRCVCYAASVVLIGTYDFVITIQDNVVILKYMGNDTISNCRTMFIPWTNIEMMSR